MKLNFWQWLGVVLLVIGVGLWVYEKRKEQAPLPEAPPATPSNISTAPAT